MKHIAILFAFAFTVSSLSADELTKAYQDEYAFLKAQKSELQNRVKKEQVFQNSELNKAKEKVQKLQDKLIAVSEEYKIIQKDIEKSTELLNDKNSNHEISASVVIQAKSLLTDYNIAVDDSAKADVIAVMDKAFRDTAELYTRLSSVRKEPGIFYNIDGTTAKGEIIKVGNVIAYGVSDNTAGALAPAGNAEYKLWNQGTGKEASAFANNQQLNDIDVFIYENLDKDIEYAKEKTIGETIEGGGTIGYIILALGGIGLLLVAIRALLLVKSGTNVNKITRTVVEHIESGKGDQALEAIKKHNGATARVIKATLRNIDKDRDHIEDIVTESILNESSHIDKFGSFILVLAAVAPLLGLLGTVTGMIATFDIITTHGTGDPKLLSGGISEALVTTMLGLIVAIPLLLLGNLLSGWAQNIKDSMEQSALHVVNQFQVSKA